MGISLNKALTYGAELPNHLARANANCWFQSDLLKENQAFGYTKPWKSKNQQKRYQTKFYNANECAAKIVIIQILD